MFPGGKKYALTFSYDDAVTQDVRLVAMMNRYGMKGTFNINTGLLGKESFHVQNGRSVTHNKLRPEEILSVYRDMSWQMSFLRKSRSITARGFSDFRSEPWNSFRYLLAWRTVFFRSGMLWYFLPF